MTSPSRTFLVATLLFFLSGMLGLGYELVWIRKAALVVGASQIALSTVLTAFFLGIGVGSYFVGTRVLSRRRSPLFVYGIFEVAIGVYALLFPLAFQLVESIYGALYPFFEGTNPGLFALRFGLLFVLFLVPTFFMGGTLPLLLDGLIAGDHAIGSRTSFLYGLNILGAVAGVLLTSYFAIPILGMDNSSRVLGVGNLLIGATALYAFRSTAPVHVARPVATEIRTPLAFFFCAAAFGSGLLAIAYQVAWARYFSLFNTGTVYLTAVLLAVFLLALAAGSFVLSQFLGWGFQPLRVFCAVQGLLPAAVIFSLELWRRAEFRYSIQGMQTATGAVEAMDTLEIAYPPAHPYQFQFATETLDAILFAPLFQVALSIFLPVLLLGMGLPALIAASARTAAGLRSVSGRVLFWNTLGASAGGFLAGYGFLPLLGLHYTLAVLALGSLALAVAAWKRSGDPQRIEPLSSRHASRADRRREQDVAELAAPRSRWIGGLSLPAIGLLAVVVFLCREDLTTYTVKFHGYGRDPDVGYDPDNPDPARRLGRMPLSEVIEGPLTTSFLFKDAQSIRIGSGNVCLAVVYQDQPCSQAIQGHVPALFYPGAGVPENCLGICLGSGQSFGALLLYPIKKLDVVDISSEIVELSLRHFAEYNHDLARDPRVRFHLDDGRHFVERAPDASYDIVSMEPPPPTADGVYSLYSFEFYEEAKRILRDDGLFMQWLPLYRITPLDARGIVKTQAAVFPETFVVKVFADDFMVVSYKKRPLISQAAMRERTRIFETERFLKAQRWNPSSQYDIASLEGVLSLVVMGPGDVARIEAPMIYHDDQQLLSYSSGDRWLLRRYEGPALSSLSFAALRPSQFADLASYFDPPLGPELASALTVERAASLAMFKMPDPRKVEEQERALQASRDPVDRARRAMSLAVAFDAMLWKEEAYSHVEMALTALRLAPADAATEHLVTAQSLVRNRLAVFEVQVADWLRRCEAAHGASPLFAAMRQEYVAFLAREKQRKAGYIFE